jgi:DNA-binding transcriptional ArsR family regulator
LEEASAMKSKHPRNDKACAPTFTLKDRPLLTPIQAGGLAAVFKVLANDTRLRLLHALARADELCVTDLASSLGMKPQAVSNQLQRLSDLGILASHRVGNNIYYRLVDLCVKGLLEHGWCLMEGANARTVLAVRMGAGCADSEEGCS